MGGDRLRLLSANLWNGGADAQAFAEQVQALGADIVAVQELAPEQAEALARVLPHGELEPDREHLGMGIALARPGRHRRLALPRRDARVLDLDPEVWPELDAPFELLNVHLMGLHARPLWANAPLRREQLRGLLAYLDAAPPRARMLVGDLNATPWMPAYRRLAARLDDAARELARRRRRPAQRTWGPGEGWPRLVRIDHVLARGVAVEEVRALPVRGSDHSAVLVDFRVG